MSSRVFAQVMSFAGAGRSERVIQTMMTMMLHSAIHWPNVADATLWPMAVAHAVYLYNHMPSLDTGISPADLFTKMRWEQRKFHDVHARRSKSRHGCHRKLVLYWKMSIVDVLLQNLMFFTVLMPGRTDQAACVATKRTQKINGTTWWVPAHVSSNVLLNLAVSCANLLWILSQQSSVNWNHEVYHDVTQNRTTPMTAPLRDVISLWWPQCPPIDRSWPITLLFYVIIVESKGKNHLISVDWLLFVS